MRFQSVKISIRLGDQGCLEFAEKAIALNELLHLACGNPHRNVLCRPSLVQVDMSMPILTYTADLTSILSLIAALNMSSCSLVRSMAGLIEES